MRGRGRSKPYTAFHMIFTKESLCAPNQLREVLDIRLRNQRPHRLGSLSSRRLHSTPFLEPEHPKSSTHRQYSVQLRQLDKVIFAQRTLLAHGETAFADTFLFLSLCAALGMNLFTGNVQQLYRETGISQTAQIAVATYY